MGALSDAWNFIAGNADPDEIGGYFKNNPMLGKMTELGDQFHDFGSEFYQRGKEYFGNVFSQQAIDQAWSTSRAQNEQLASQGIDQGSGIGLRKTAQTFKDFGTNAFNQTKKSLMDMWQAGQQIGQNYIAGAAEIHADAAAAAAAQASQNASNSGSTLQTLMGIGVGMLAFSDERCKKNIKKLGDDCAYGCQMYSFEYKHPAWNGRHYGLMAQEVQAKHPEAVWEHPDGWLMINYDVLEKKFPPVYPEGKGPVNG